MTDVDFVKGIVSTFPDLGPILNEHVADYDEILPHVFMADVLRYVLASGPHRQQIVEYLDRNFRGNGDEVENVIAVSFVESIEDEHQLEQALGGAEAKALREEWHAQQD
jgi:hypothetical protein